MSEDVEARDGTPRIAILVEDDDGVRRSLQLLLHWRGYEVRSFASATPIFAQPLPEGVDTLIADYRLPDGNGIDVLRELRRQGWSGRSVLITGYPASDVVTEAIACGYDRILEKPLRQQALVAALDAPGGSVTFPMPRPGGAS